MKTNRIASLLMMMDAELAKVGNEEKFYSFESGVTYDENGFIIDYDIDKLILEVESIASYVELDSIELIEQSRYSEAITLIRLVERLDSMMNEIDR